MKQTPIPEKIKPQYDKLGYPTGTWMYINSLIDVLTEQQKEIEKLRKHKHITYTGKLTGQTDEPYTAMRSTGECACKCHPTQYEEYGYSCQKCWGFHESKAHKPQEDVIEDIVIDLIIEAWDLGYKKDGKNRHLIQKYKDRILAIVKGE